jgi:arylsulfatase A-like enzyme
MGALNGWAWCIINLLLLFCCSLSFGQSNSRPNIVIMLIDDLGIMDSSVPFLTDPLGHPARYPLNDLYRTPNMQRLAENGIRFSNFYAMSVCSPTRISILTGQNAARHRTTNWINPFTDNGGSQGPAEWNWQGLKGADTTLARLFQQVGYRTIHVGKGHFGPQGSEGADPINLGFDVNVGGAAWGSPGSYAGRDDFGRATEGSRNPVPHLDKYHGTQTHLTEALTLEARREISQSVDAGRPFLLYFPHYAVHAPFQVDERFASNYQDLGLSPQGLAFATLVEGVDKSLGDILDHLVEQGIAENTLVLFLGDNGTDAPLGHEHAVACAAPLRGKKGSHYEGGMRVPMIGAWAKPNSQRPGQRRLPIARNRIQTQVASVCDLFPTLARLVGLPVPADHVVDGFSLDQLMAGKRDPNRPERFLMHYPHGPHRSSYFTVYRDGPWKLIYHYFPSEVSEGSHFQLFKLESDPFEQRNLALERPEMVSSLARQMMAALSDQRAVYPDGVKEIALPAP